MSSRLRVLMITSEWPTPETPNGVPFVVRQVEFLRNAGVQVDLFHFRGSKKLANYLKAWRRLRQQLSANEYDVVHAQWGQSALIALPKRLPLVITYRGSDLEGIAGVNGGYTFKGRALRIMSKFMARAADEVIVVSERLANRLPNGKPFHVIPSGVDLDVFRPIPRLEARRKLGLSESKSLVLFAASPTNPVKRYQLAQESVMKLEEQFETELVVASKVQYTQMPHYMSACDALVLTSLHEGSPNVVKEALACDLPVVSVDVGDVRERIGSVEGCVLCADDRSENIAAGLAQVLSKNMRLDSRKTVVDLDEKVLTKRVISVYEQAVSRV